MSIKRNGGFTGGVGEGLQLTGSRIDLKLDGGSLAKSSAGVYVNTNASGGLTADYMGLKVNGDPFYFKVDDTNQLVSKTLTVANCVAAGSLYSYLADSSTYNYANSNGVGDYIALDFYTYGTNNSSFPTIDSFAWQQGDTILVVNEGSISGGLGANANGLYKVTTADTNTWTAVLTRLAGFDTGTNIGPGQLVWVKDGSSYNDTLWVQIENVNTVGASGTGDSINFTQLKGNGTYSLPSEVPGTGAASANDVLTYNGSATVWSAVSVPSTLSDKSLVSPIFTSPEEAVTVSATAATGTINFYTQNGSVLYYTTNATANFVLNFDYSSSDSLANTLQTNNSITCVFLNTNGSTAYYPTSIQVDGSTTNVTTRWQGGTAPSSGNASSVDAYVVTIIKTAATPAYSIFASQTKFA